MLKAAAKSLCGLLFYFSLTGCAALDALQLMYGNKHAPHTWQGDAKTTTIPFELLNEHTIITATINGIDDVRMLLDTGASATVFFETEKTQPLLSKLDSKFTVGGIGNGERTDAYFIHDTDLKVGSVTISGLTTVFLKADDNPMFPTSEVTYIDGVIGYDLFSRFTTEINFTRQTVTVSEGPLVSAAGYQSIPLRIKNNLASVEISVHGGEKTATLPALLDTGGVGSLLMNAKPGVPQGEVLYQTTSSGLGGESEVTANRLEKVVFGQHEIANVIAGVSQEATNKNNILGTGILNRFNLIIDYPSQQVLISPNQQFDKIDYVNVFGAGFLPHINGAFINALRPDSPAAQMGFQQADVIVTVNGDRINHQNFDAYREQLATLSSVTEICYLRSDKGSCEVVEHNEGI